MNATHGMARIGVIGSGTMGQGIAQIAAQGGLQVQLFDQNPEAVARALSAIGKVLDQQVAKGRLDPSQRDACVQRLVPALSANELTGCDLVVEAIVEDLSLKQALFRQLEEIVSQGTILATNTSSLSVTAIASKCREPRRVVGWHFFNPVPLMKIAEVVRGECTDRAVSERVAALTAALGHRPVQAVDSPGFIVNHAGRAFIPEGLRLLSEGVGEAADIDRVMRDCAGFRMGPFELLDLVGLDVGQMVMESLYHQYQEEPRFRITPLVARKVAAEQLGRKSGHGFYRYENGKTVVPPEPAWPEPSEATRVRPLWISPDEPDLAAKVREHLERGRSGHIEAGDRPSPEAVAVVTPVGEDVATMCKRQNLEPARTVAVDALFPLDRRCVLMTAPGFDADLRADISAAFAAPGAALTWLRDSPGFVAQRIVAQIVNIGADMAQHELGTPEDIDTAVTLALGYPRGPFGLADHLGAARMLRISEALYAAYGDPRYRPSIWLRRRAQLGQPLRQPA